MLSRTMLMGKMKWGNCKGKNFCEIFVQQLLCFLPSSLGLVQLQIFEYRKIFVLLSTEADTAKRFAI